MSLHVCCRGAAAVAFLCAALWSPARAQGHEHEHQAEHSMVAGPFGISMDRMGSGTTWIPDAVTLPSRHTMLGDWELMLHGFAFGQYDKQYGPRGDEQFGSLNWAMLMATRELGGGRFQARTMLSLDPATVTPRGYPLLLQTGEVHRGAPIVDRQHPHDFWMELGALYERELSSRVALSLYAAPSGEPALSPVAFMHRPSAMDDPAAPLGHHWQDATHITFGVLTAGLFGRSWKLEGSWFNGREPDEHRYNFDRPRLDSYSGRLTLNPAAEWSMSAGCSLPGVNRRMTVSVSPVFRSVTSGSSAACTGRRRVLGREEPSTSCPALWSRIMDRAHPSVSLFSYGCDRFIAAQCSSVFTFRAPRRPTANDKAESW